MSSTVQPGSASEWFVTAPGAFITSREFMVCNWRSFLNPWFLRVVWKSQYGCDLTILARYDAKIRPPLHVSLNNSVTRPSFKKSVWQLFDQVAKDRRRRRISRSMVSQDTLAGVLIAIGRDICAAWVKWVPPNRWGNIRGKVVKDAKCVLTFSRWPLEPELKFKMAEFSVF